MDIGLKQNLNLGLGQEQQMNQSQIQALEMLAVPVLELQEFVDKELEINPILDTEPIPEEDYRIKADDKKNDDWVEQMIKLSDDSRYIRTNKFTSFSEDDEERRQYYLDSAVYEKSLQESLSEQLRFLDLTPKMFSCCESIISSLDDSAYLKTHPADLAMVSGENLDTVEIAIKIIKTLEPAGVAAGSTQERLLLQIERLGKNGTLLHRVVLEQYDKLVANHLPLIARALRITMDELQVVLEEMQSLNLKIVNDPVSPHEYVTEEVTVKEEKGELALRINNEYLPNLYISKHYKDLLKDPETPKETQIYIKDKLKSGVNLINNIIQRQSTIRKVVNAIIAEQEEYFYKGPTFLKPLNMNSIAKIAGVHETTVSRTVAGKFLRCKHGLIALRNFFSTGYVSADGDDLSKDVVKDTLKTIIENEDTKKPYSDDKLSQLMKEKGFKVARRTVAKYRESMNILKSNLRRKY